MVKRFLVFLLFNMLCLIQLAYIFYHGSDVTFKLNIQVISHAHTHTLSLFYCFKYCITLFLNYKNLQDCKRMDVECKSLNTCNSECIIAPTIILSGIYFDQFQRNNYKNQFVYVISIHTLTVYHHQYNVLLKMNFSSLRSTKKF